MDFRLIPISAFCFRLYPHRPRHSPRLRSKEMSRSAQNSSRLSGACGKGKEVRGKGGDGEVWGKGQEVSGKGVDWEARGMWQEVRESPLTPSPLPLTPSRFPARSCIPYHMLRFKLRQNFLLTPETRNTTSSGRSGACCGKG